MGPTHGRPQRQEEGFPTENTLAAFQAAFDDGADGIECDIQISKDGVAMITHDYALNGQVAGADPARTDLGTVGDHTAAQLQAMDLGQGKHMPQLADVLDLYCRTNPAYRAEHGHNRVINLDLRRAGSADIVYDTVMAYVRDGRLNKEDFVFNSFKWDELAALKKRDPALRISPSLPTKEMFGEENVTMPGYYLKPGCSVRPEFMQKLEAFQQESPCFGVDCNISNLRPEIFAFAEKHHLCLFGSDYKKGPGYRQALDSFISNRCKNCDCVLKMDDVSTAIPYVRMAEMGRVRLTTPAALDCPT